MIARELRHGKAKVVVSDYGATLLSYTDADRPIVWGFGADDQPWGCQGEQLAPWPNRIRDGRYSFAGTDYQLPITEPARQTALHGLVNHRDWEVAEIGDDFVTHTLVLDPEPGWPGRLELRLKHSLGAEGLRVDVWAKNVGAARVPFGYGAHPYLYVPDDANCLLKIPAATQLLVDDRLLPVGLAPVAETAYDFRQARPIGQTQFDTAFTDVSFDSDGLWRATVTVGDHTSIVWADQSYGWIQCYTPPHNRHVALEPMTCGPDAFNVGPTHEGLLLLEPGDTYSGSWGIAHN